ncbi:hypothetical protein LDENG_00211620, partial [Lucifuga dentata]
RHPLHHDHPGLPARHGRRARVRLLLSATATSPRGAGESSEREEDHPGDEVRP